MNKTNKYFYGFEYADGINTTAGTPNTKTGRMSTAGLEFAFTTKSARDAWVARGCSSRGGRIAVTLQGLRKANCGMTSTAFDAMLADVRANAN